MSSDKSNQNTVALEIHDGDNSIFVAADVENYAVADEVGPWVPRLEVSGRTPFGLLDFAKPGAKWLFGLGLPTPELNQPYA